MRARDVMTTEVLTVTPETSIVNAVKLMLERHVSGVPVVENDGRLAGILTEGDFMRRAELATGQRPWWVAQSSSPEDSAKAYAKAHGLKVRDVMTPDVVTIEEDDSIDAIAMKFEENGIKRAPVMRGGRIIGIVSRANILQGLATAKIGEARPSDGQIKLAIMVAAHKDATLRIPLLDVTVADGVVHLWGNMASETERSAIRAIAETTDGVREVEDHLRILPPSIFEWKPE